MPRLQSHVLCSGMSVPNLPWQWSGFRTLHAGGLKTATPEVAEYEIRDWVQGNGQVLWSKTYVQFGRSGSSASEEATTLELRHTSR
jgi:hypothetical protein